MIEIALKPIPNETLTQNLNLGKEVNSFADLNL